mgnify:CR=1 FL=1
MRRSLSDRMVVLAPIAVLAILLLGLELIVYVFKIPRQVLPSPHAILLALYTNFASAILSHLMITLYVILAGFVIGVPVGIFLAALLSQYKIVEKAFSPYVILLVTTPMITLVPLFMMWFGFGINVRVFVVILQTVPIVILNSITGFNTVDSSKIELADSMGATRIQKFVKIIFPNALPQVFTGIKLGGIFATIAAITAGFSGAKSGLGNRVLYFSKFIETEIAFACIILIALIGISLYMLISQVESRVIVWRR